MMLILSWFVSSFFFGASFIGAGFVSKYSMPLEFMMFYRLMMSSLIILIVLLLRKERILIRKNEVFVSIIVSMGQLNVWLACYGTKYLISGLVPCITLLQIFVAELLSSIFDKRRMRTNIIISGIIGSIGIAMLCNQQLVGVGNANLKDTLIGIFFSFISTFAAAGCNLFYEKSSNVLKNMPRSTFMFYNCFFAGMFLLLLGLIINPIKELFDPSLLDYKYLTVMFFLALTATVLALYALYYIIEKQGSVKATYLNFIIPIISMIISTIWEGFVWNKMAIFGMLILLYSVWIGVRQTAIVSQNGTIFQKIFHLIIK